MGGTKAVALGACRYGLFKPVQSRISPAWFGIRARRGVEPDDAGHPAFEAHRSRGRRGEDVLNGVFSSILKFQEDILDSDWSSADFALVLDQSRLASSSVAPGGHASVSLLTALGLSVLLP